jgi:hypothetical protein
MNSIPGTIAFLPLPGLNSFLKRASGGQVVFSVAQKFELDEFPPDNDPNVDFTPQNYAQLRSQSYDMWNHGKANYVAICNDPRFGIIPRVEAQEVDAIWVFGPDGTGFWETAMAGAPLERCLRPARLQGPREP